MAARVPCPGASWYSLVDFPRDPKAGICRRRINRGLLAALDGNSHYPLARTELPTMGKGDGALRPIKPLPSRMSEQHRAGNELTWRCIW